MIFSEEYNNRISSFDEIEKKAIEGDKKTIKALIDMGCNLTTLFHTYSAYSKHPERNIEASQSLLFILLKLDSPDLFNYAYEKLKTGDKNLQEDFYFLAWEKQSNTHNPLFTHYKSNPGSSSQRNDSKYNIYYTLPEMIQVIKQSWNIDTLFKIKEDAIMFYNKHKKMDLKSCEEIFSIENNLNLFFEQKLKSRQDFSIYPNDFSDKRIIDFFKSWEKNFQIPLLSSLTTDNIFSLLYRSKDSSITQWLINDVNIDKDILYDTRLLNLKPNTQDYLIPLLDINKKSDTTYKIDFHHYGIDCNIGSTLKEYMENFILIMTNPDKFLQKDEVKDNSFFHEICESVDSIQQNERFLNLKSIYEKILIRENTLPQTNEPSVKKRI